MSLPAIVKKTSKTDDKKKRFLAVGACVALIALTVLVNAALTGSAQKAQDSAQGEPSFEPSAVSGTVEDQIVSEADGDYFCGVPSGS